MICTFNGATTLTTATWTVSSGFPVLSIKISNICTASVCLQNTFTVVCTGNMKNPPTVSTISQVFTISTTNINNYVVD